MTKVVFIASALFLLSVIFKSNLERPGEVVPAEVAASDSWSDKVAGLATGLNELLASEPTRAGQQVKQANVLVREELVDPAKYDVTLNNGTTGTLANAGSGSVQSLVNTGSLPMPSSQLANIPVNSSKNATVPLVTNPADGLSSEDAIPKVTEKAGKFYVQYGIFSSACRSEQVKEKLAQAGIYSVMDKLDPEGAQWILKSKAYASRAEAIYNLQTAQRKGYESYLVTAN